MELAAGASRANSAPKANRAKTTTKSSKTLKIFNQIEPETRGFLTAFKRHFKNSTLPTVYPTVGNLVKTTGGNGTNTNAIMYFLFDKKKKEKENLSSTDIEKAVSVALLNVSTSEVSLVSLTSIKPNALVNKKVSAKDLKRLQKHTVTQLIENNVRIVAIGEAEPEQAPAPKAAEKPATKAPAATTKKASEKKAVSKDALLKLMEIPAGTAVDVYKDGKKLGRTTIVRYLPDTTSLANCRVVFTDSFNNGDNPQRIWRLSQISMQVAGETPIKEKTKKTKDAPVVDTTPTPAPVPVAVTKSPAVPASKKATKVDTKVDTKVSEFQPVSSYTIAVGDNVDIVTKKVGKQFNGVVKKINTDNIILEVNGKKYRIPNDMEVKLTVEAPTVETVEEEEIETPVAPEVTPAPVVVENESVDSDVVETTPEKTSIGTDTAEISNIKNNKVKEINLASAIWQKNKKYVLAHDIGTIVDITDGKSGIIANKVVIIAYICDYYGLKNLSNKSYKDLPKVLMALVVKDGDIFVAPITNIRLPANEVEKVSAAKLLDIRNKVFQSIIQYIDSDFQDKFRNADVDAELLKEIDSSAPADTTVTPVSKPTDIDIDEEISDVKQPSLSPLPSKKTTAPMVESIPEVEEEKTIQTTKTVTPPTDVVTTQEIKPPVRPTGTEDRIPATPKPPVEPKFKEVKKEKVRARFPYTEIDLEDVSYRKFLLNAKYLPRIGTITPVVYNGRVVLSEGVIIRYLFDPEKKKVMVLVIGKNNIDPSVKVTNECVVLILSVNGLAVTENLGRVDSNDLVKLYEKCLDTLYEKFIPKKDNTDPMIETSSNFIEARDRMFWYMNNRR